MKLLFSQLFYLLLLMIVSVNLFAVDFNVNAETDDSGKPNPSFSFFFDWDENKTYYSGISFKKIVSSDSSSIEGFSESKNVTLYDEYNLNVSFINYRLNLDSISLIFGFDSEFRKIENSEVGYFLLPAAMTGQWVSFDNNIKINALMPGFNLGFKFENSIFKIDLIGKYIPFYYLGVKQKTYFRPIINGCGEKTSNSYTSNAFEINSNLIVNLGMITPWLSAYHSFWTTEHDLKSLQYTSATTSFSFSDKTEIAKHTESKLILNFLLNSESLFGNMRPYIGGGYRKQSHSSELGDKIEKESEWIITFGVNSK